MECLNNYKNMGSYQTEDIIENIKQEPIKIEEEITIEEHKIEFNQDYYPIKEDIDNELEIKQEISEDKNHEFDKLTKPNNSNIINENIESSIDWLINLINIVPEIPNKNEPKKFRCDVCNKLFGNLETLKTHRSVHNNKCVVRGENINSGERPHETTNNKNTFVKSTYSLRHKSKGDKLFSDSNVQNEDICSEVSNDVNNHETRKKVHDSDVCNKCDKCHELFDTSSDLNNHMLTHINERPFKCDDCDKSFKLLSSVDVHKKIYCSKSKTLDADKLQLNLKMCNKEFPYKCKVCPKSFITLSSLKRHMTSHSNERPHKCNVCAKKFKLLYTLYRHKKIHSSKRAYKCTICKCDICFKEFKDLIELKSHKIVQHDEQSFKCDFCSRRFNNVDKFNYHKKMHTGELNHKCGICKQSFRAPSGLKRHMVAHSNERSFKCDICAKTFKSKSNLTSHKQLHSDKRPFECDVCAKSFKTVHILADHKNVHSGERPYKCWICKKAFAISGNLMRHKKKVHNK